MARPREFDPRAALQTAIDVFWEKGYFDASVDEVVRRSGVAKYGLYGTFGTKRELFIAALKQYGKDRRTDIQEPIRRPGASLPQILEYFREGAKRVMHTSSNKRGCLLCNSGIELGSQDPEIRSIVGGFFSEQADVLKACLETAIENGEIDPDSDIGNLSKFLATEFRVLVMLAASGTPLPEIENHLEVALQVLN